MNKQFISRIISAIQLSIVLLVLCMATIIFVYANQDFGSGQSNQNGAVGVVAEAKPVVALTDEQNHGKELFTNNCASCHSVTDEALVGPGLKGVTARRTAEWIIPWVNNPQKVIASGDKYAVDLYNKFNQAQMTAFPNLKPEDVKAILSYVDAQ
jgi:mono/diheme cytochrome c family protein